MMVEKMVVHGDENHDMVGRKRVPPPVNALYARNTKKRVCNCRVPAH